MGSSDVNTLIRKIPIINLKFVPLKAELLAHKSILNLNERPYLHIFIGFCEVNFYVILLLLLINLGH